MTRAAGGRLLRLLRDEGPCTRALLSERLGLPRTAVGAELRPLQRAGLVAEGPTAPSTGGRRSGTVRLGPAVRVAAVSVGESRVRAVVLDPGFVVTRPVTVEVDDTPGRLGERAAEALVEAMDGDDAVLAVGLSLAPDPRDASTPRTDDRADEVRRALAGVTHDSPVVLEGAARAMARGERHAGAAQGSDDLVVLRIGATVRAAAYVDGHLGRGSDGQAGAVGHSKVDEFGPACVCGSSGCLDSFVSIGALRELAESAARSGRSPSLAAVLASTGAVGLSDLAAAVSGGDPVAVQLARDVGRRVGETVAGLVAFANPTTVLIGGPVAVLGPHLLNEVRGVVYRRSPAGLAATVHVGLGVPGDRAVLLGAALAASDHAFAHVS